MKKLLMEYIDERMKEIEKKMEIAAENNNFRLGERLCGAAMELNNVKLFLINTKE